MKSPTIVNIIILTIITSVITYFILYTIKPSYLIKKNGKFYIIKGLLLSIFFSTIFSYIIGFISVKVDERIYKSQL